MEECQLPLIDLSGLRSCDERVRAECKDAICRASSEWGFFQVVSHGIEPELVSKMKEEQVKLFQLPFDRKAKVMVEFAAAMSKLAVLLAGVLAENLGYSSRDFEEICQEDSCFLRLNRYPACPMSPEIFGLVPHTDSDFLTILSQDQVGGLQLMKDSRWVAVKPNQDALIVNIGDLFQAWSNDVYKSVEHKVVANAKMERYSMAYFLCPSYDTSIESCREPSKYRKFTFGEYRSQIQEDVKKHGHKIGLPSFRL
ncbi:Gibberellin 2-beta-dioxygenase 8 [Linum perenne]